MALAERLKELCELDGGAFFCNSGAEANEAAIKLARRRGRARGGPDKHHIVCLEGSFHGRTLGDAAGHLGAGEEGAVRAAAGGLRARAPGRPRRAARRPSTPPPRRSCSSPCRARAACTRWTPGFLALARELCDRHDALLICDEVQTGIGRCGAWLASRRLGRQPDAVTLAKGLGVAASRSARS